MVESNININLIAIKTMLESGKISKMSQLDKLSPTFIAKELHINYGRYINKLYKPELFEISELMRLSKLIDIRLKIIVDVILKEIEKE